ncbi:hypothetical protein SAMN05880501_105169 [Ureibacillus xyleni]|uniref:Uncharacterized protein n=1 Tax=Ureibacillus xyleni TaxID=614648 RepID=A0A285SLY1_9BACL|nr:hypothetical protein [Ureibacillus xyleni]SOC09027.1 hypothetical protein SAMN05880501_105169 [Ureibacillus xyleni]
MLISRSLNFQHHDLLTVQMLEGLRDNTLEGVLAAFITYADGIVNGLTVTMDMEHQICISPGVIKWNNKLYVMTEEERIPLEKDCRHGLIVARPTETAFIVTTTSQLDEGDLELSRFERDTGSLVSVPQQFNQLKYLNQFDIRYRKIGGCDQQLTYGSEFARLFAQSLLSCPGVTMSDTAFAWQAIQHPPTKTMWETFLKQNELNWLEDSKEFYEQLIRLLNKKMETPSTPYFVQREQPTAIKVNENIGIIVD